MDLFQFVQRQFNKYIGIPLVQRKFNKICILNSLDSIQYIIEHKCSVSRFGDGEFDVMMGKDGNTFQKADNCLAERLMHVLTATDVPNHIVGIPLPLKCTTNLRASSRDFWGYYVKHNINKLLPLLSENRIYIDTQLSRFFMMYKEHRHCEKQLKLLKQIWNNRDIVIVEGCKSRTGVGNDLYDNARSVRRILGLSVNAFEKYNEMLDAILLHTSQEQLILLSYGMCATVLAYDLAKLGYQAIDIGHLDIEYEWMRMGAVNKTPIKGKYTNEAGEDGRKKIVENIDSKYECEIVCDISKMI